mmetsp:Transcript_8852/g.8762  ORF Transcript_8852/g.8762 Transcript_8852/m.8762 type:complete len:103 (-) Transcript_8852:515-823(-)
MVTKVKTGTKISTSLLIPLRAIVPMKTPTQTRALAPTPFNTTIPQSCSRCVKPRFRHWDRKGSLINNSVLYARNQSKNKNHPKFEKKENINTSATILTEALP